MNKRGKEKKVKIGFDCGGEALQQADPRVGGLLDRQHVHQWLQKRPNAVVVFWDDKEGSGVGGFVDSSSADLRCWRVGSCSGSTSRYRWSENSNLVDWDEKLLQRP